MKRLVVAVLAIVGISVVSAVTAIMATAWTDTRTSSGNVAASTTPDLLYIRDASGAAGCDSGDDSGADETIFDNPVQVPLLPDGPPAEASICLINISVSPWEITGIVPTFTETSDPSGTCTDIPVVGLEIWNDAATVDDPNLGIQPQFLPAVHHLSTSYWRTIHVAPTQSEQLRIRASLPASLPAECQGVTWNLSIAWTATIV